VTTQYILHKIKTFCKIKHDFFFLLSQGLGLQGVWYAALAGAPPPPPATITARHTHTVSHTHTHTHTFAFSSATPPYHNRRDTVLSPTHVLQCVAVSCSVVQCVAVCCSVLQCVAVKVFIRHTPPRHNRRGNLSHTLTHAHGHPLTHPPTHPTTHT